MTSSCMNNYARWLVDHNKVISFINNLNRYIQDRRFNSDRHMNNLISIFKDILRIYLFVIHFNFPILNRFFIVFRRISFELFDQSGKQSFTDPSSFGESFVSIWVGLNKTKWKLMNIDRFLLLFLVYLHNL